MKSLRFLIVRVVLRVAICASACLFVGFSGCLPKKTDVGQTSDLDSFHLKQFLGDFIGFLKGKGSKTSEELAVSAAKTAGKIEAMKSTQKALPRNELDEIKQLAESPENNAWKLLEMTKGNRKTRQYVNQILDEAGVTRSMPAAELQKGSMESNLIDTYTARKYTQGLQSYGLLSRERDPARTAATLLSKKIRVAGFDAAKFNALVDEASTATRNVERKNSNGNVFSEMKEIRIFTIRDPFKPEANNPAKGALNYFNNNRNHINSFTSVNSFASAGNEGILRIALNIGVSTEEVAITFDGIPEANLKKFLENVKASLAYTNGRPGLQTYKGVTSEAVVNNGKSLVIPNNDANQKYIDTLFKMFGTAD